MLKGWMSFCWRNNMNQITKDDFLQGYSPDKVFITLQVICIYIIQT